MCEQNIRILRNCLPVFSSRESGGCKTKPLGENLPIGGPGCAVEPDSFQGHPGVLQVDGSGQQRLSFLTRFVLECDVVVSCYENFMLVGQPANRKIKRETLNC